MILVVALLLQGLVAPPPPPLCMVTPLGERVPRLVPCPTIERGYDEAVRNRPPLRRLNDTDQNRVLRKYA